MVGTENIVAELTQTQQIPFEEQAITFINGILSGISIAEWSIIIGVLFLLAVFSKAEAIMGFVFKAATLFIAIVILAILFGLINF